MACGDLLPELIRLDIKSIGLIDVSVEYAWKPLMCTKCKALGHTDQFCKAPKEWKLKSHAEGTFVPKDATNTS